MVFTLFGLHTRRASHNGCRSKLSFLYPSNKMLLQFSWTHFPVNHNKWPSKRPTLTRDAIQYETKRDFSTSPHNKQNNIYIYIYIWFNFHLVCWSIKITQILFNLHLYLLLFDRIHDAMCLNKMSRTSSRNIGPQNQKYSSIFNWTHGAHFIPGFTKLILSVCYKKANLFVSSDHRIPSHLKFQLSLITEYAGVCFWMS